MNKNTRNIIIALIFLVVLLVEPFWGRITAAIQGEEYVTGASVEAQEGTEQTTGATPEEDQEP